MLYKRTSSALRDGRHRLSHKLVVAGPRGSASPAADPAPHPPPRPSAHPAARSWDLLHWRVKDALPVGSSAHTARMVSAIDGALGGVMARALLLSVQSPPLNATDPEMALDGWQDMRVRKASKQEAEEEEAVRNLIALLRQLHAFRSEAISQVEALLDGDRGSAGR